MPNSKSNINSCAFKTPCQNCPYQYRHPSLILRNAAHDDSRLKLTLIVTQPTASRETIIAVASCIALGRSSMRAFVLRDASAKVHLFEPAPYVRGVPMEIVGHRGACGEAPENTLRSFARAIELGCD